jgi:hypothetical protein
MKTLLRFAPGLGSLLLLALGLAAGASAADQKTPPPCPYCPYCHTVAITRTSATSGGGKLQPQVAVVGVGHDCDSCSGGTIAVVGGKVTNRMQVTCPLCKRADPPCCEAPKADKS